MGGDDHLLGGVEVRPLGERDRRADLHLLKSQIGFQFGSVGTPLVNLIAILGPAKKMGDDVWYWYDAKKEIKGTSGQSVDYDTSATLRVKITAGRISAIDVRHVTSN